MACGSCGGGQRANVAYLVTLKHDGSQQTVATLAEARLLIEQAPQKGTVKTVPKKVV